MMHTALFINELLEETLPEIGKILFDVFHEEVGNNIVCRFDPSNASTKEYIDGSKIGTLNLSYYARNKNASVARQNLESICKVFDSLKEFRYGDLVLQSRSQSLPQFVSVDDKKQTYYTCSVSIDFEEVLNEYSILGETPAWQRMN